MVYDGCFKANVPVMTTILEMSLILLDKSFVLSGILILHDPYGMDCLLQLQVYYFLFTSFFHL